MNTKTRRAVGLTIASMGFVCVLASSPASAEDIAPARIRTLGGKSFGVFSERTLAVAIQVDRSQASLLAFTLKPRVFERRLELAEAVPLHVNGEQNREGEAVGQGTVQLEISLQNARGDRYLQRIDLAGVCFDHAPDTPAHIAGDTIRLHRESLVVEVPDLPGFDRVEVAYATEREGIFGRVDLGTLTLGSERFTVAGGSLQDSDRASAHASTVLMQAAADASARSRSLDLGTPAASYDPVAAASGSGSSSPLPLTSGAVHWPEEFGDPDKVMIFGGGDPATRVNIVIVPDGYTYAEKPTMLAHAQSLVNAFRAKTPYKEHDPFINYILVFAYSTESGTDQCDCGIVKDTAMASRFPLSNQAPCGHSDNRCLFYGNGNGGPDCDPNVSTANVAAAELRAPADDRTLIMVNTTRYGGCGGSRAVYSAGNPSATEIAMHELGHSIAGLADEYAGTNSCGSFAGNVNTSLDSVNGAWPEWIGDIGVPRQGAQYYNSCIYRPEDFCEMQILNAPFCHVCNQRWALTYFGHFRVAPTAPITSMTPPTSPIQTQVGLTNAFSVQTRLASGPGVTNSYTWRLRGPGFPTPTVVSTGAPAYARSFSQVGSYTLSSEVIADTNFVKKERNGANLDTASWSVQVTGVPEVSDDAIHELTLSKNAADASLVDLRFENVGSSRYNLYVSTAPRTVPFAVTDPAVGRKDCAASGVTSAPEGMLQLTGYDLGAGLPAPPGSVVYLLVTADNGPATEGSLGSARIGLPLTPRTADSYCSH